MHQQKLQALSLGALLTLVTLAGVASGAGGPLDGATPCADNFTLPPSAFVCPLVDPTVDAVDTLVASAPDPAELAAALTDGCTQPATDLTGPSMVLPYVSCAAANAAGLAPNSDELVCDQLQAPEGTTASTCINSVICDALERTGTNVAACATDFATAAVSAILAPQVLTFTAPASPEVAPFAVSGTIDPQIFGDVRAALLSLSGTVPATVSGANDTADDNTGTLVGAGTAAGAALASAAAQFNLVGTMTASAGSTVSGLAFNSDANPPTFTATVTPTAPGPVHLDLAVTFQFANLLVLPQAKALVTGHGVKDVTVVNNVVPNVAPVARAGGDQVITSGFGVTLNGTTSSDANAGDTLTYAWTQIGTPAVTLANANQAVATFTAPTVATLTSLLFELTVSDGALSSTDNVTVQVQPASGSTHVDINDSATDLDLLTAGFTGPAAGTASNTSLTVRLHDLNGVATLTNSLLEAHLTGPAALNASLTHGTPVDDNPEGDGDTQRDFPYALAFGGRLKGGAYEFAATYDGSAPVMHGFNVTNVAPALVAPAPLVRTHQAGFGAVVTDFVEIALNDNNWGSFDGAPVTELQSLDFSGVPSGFVAQVSTNGGATWTDVPTGSHDLSAVTNGAGALTVRVRLNSTSGLITPGDYVVTATVTDQGALASAASPLYTLTVRPQNYGFSLSVNDGGDGIALGSGNAGSRVNSSADPVAVSFTGTFAASNLTVRVSPFTCTCGGSFGAYNANPEKNGKVLIYGAVDLSDTPIEVPVTSAGTAFFPNLGSLGGSGTAVYVVLNLYLPASTPAGSYSGVIDVTGMGTA